MGRFFVGRTPKANFHLMFNEGGRFFNFTLIWYKKNWTKDRIFFYIYAGGKRWHT